MLAALASIERLATLKGHADTQSISLQPMGDRDTVMGEISNESVKDAQTTVSENYMTLIFDIYICYVNRFLSRISPGMTPTHQQVQPRYQYPTVVLLVPMPTLPLLMKHEHERGKICSGCIENGFLLHL
jgi:hypothetical protein